MNYLKALLISCWALLLPIHSIIYATTILIMVDTITGILAAKKRKEKIRSSKYRNVVSKAIIYNIALITAFIVEKYMQFDIVPVIKLTAAAIGSTEFLSIAENLNTINGKNIFQSLKSAIGSSNLPKED